MKHYIRRLGLYDLINQLDDQGLRELTREWRKRWDDEGLNDLEWQYCALEYGGWEPDEPVEHEYFTVKVYK